MCPQLVHAVEDFKPEMYYKSGPLNIEAGFCSCHHILPSSEENAAIMTGNQLEHCLYHEAMLNYPVDIHVLFPLDFRNIRQAQQAEPALLALLDQERSAYQEYHGCDLCQYHKQPGQPYHHLPPRNGMAVPWEEFAVDLVGPWKVLVPEIGELRF
jgi:hypothetical protein